MSLKVIPLLLEVTNVDTWYSQFKNLIDQEVTWNQNYYCFQWVNDERTVVLMNFMLNANVIKPLYSILDKLTTVINLIFVNDSNTDLSSKRMKWRINEYVLQTYIHTIKNENYYSLHDHYFDIIKIVEANSSIFYKLTKLIFYKTTQQSVNTRTYPFEVKFFTQMNVMQNALSNVLENESETKISEGELTFKHLKEAKVEEHGSILCLMTLHSQLKSNNDQCIAQQSYQKYNDWINNNVFTCFKNISQIFTKIINNLLINKIDKLRDITDLQNYNIKTMLNAILTDSDILIDQYAFKALHKNICLTIKYWIKLCALLVPSDETVENKGQLMIKLLKLKIADYEVVSSIVFDYTKIGVLL